MLRYLPLTPGPTGESEWPPLNRAGKGFSGGQCTQDIWPEFALCRTPAPPPCPLSSPSDQSNWIKMTPIIDSSCSRAQTQWSISECVCNWCLCSQRSVVAPCSPVYLGSARLSFQPDPPQRVLAPWHHERNREVPIFTDIWEITTPSFHQLFVLHNKHVLSWKWTILVTGCLWCWGCEQRTKRVFWNFESTVIQRQY